MTNLLPKDGEAFYQPNIFTPTESQRLFHTLQNEIKWRHKPIILFGKRIMFWRDSLFSFSALHRA